MRKRALIVEVRRLRSSLAYFVGDGRCENYTHPVGFCFEAGRTADARYGADRACVPCVASRMLEET